MDEREALFTQAVKADPGYAEAHTQRGSVRLSQRRNDEARADFDAALAIDPNLARAHFGRGLSYYNVGNAAAALPCFDEAIANDPRLAKAYAARAGAKVELGRLSEAVPDLERSIALRPNNAFAHHALGMIAFKRRETQKAIECFSRAVKSDPGFNRGLAYFNRGRARRQLNDNRAAALDFEQALQQGMTATEQATTMRLFIRQVLGREPRVEPVEKTLAQRSVELVFTGKAKRAQGDHAGSIVDYDEAIALNPKNFEAYGRRAAAKVKLGRNEGAIRDLNVVIKNMRSPDAFRLRGLAKKGLGDMKGAALDFEEYLVRDTVRLKPKDRREARAFMTEHLGRAPAAAD
jgi:tetratricopeptide (TPR) repeat protein